MEQARTDHFALEADIQAQGKPFELLYSLYAAAMKVGNEYIDISELHEYQDAATLIASFRKYGVEAFTFSSGWSSAVESAWTFLQNGCTLAGMVEINGPHKGLWQRHIREAPGLPVPGAVRRQAYAADRQVYRTAGRDSPRSFSGNSTVSGYIFKDEAAFLSHPDQVCYVPELSDTAYTRNDLLALCDGQEKLGAMLLRLPELAEPDNVGGRAIYLRRMGALRGMPPRLRRGRAFLLPALRQRTGR